MNSDLTTVATLSGGGIIFSYVVPENVAYIRMTAAVVYARWFLLTRDQAFDEEQLLQAVTAGSAAIESNLYDKTTADYGYRNADHSATSSVSHWSSKEFAVAANDTIFFGPCNIAQGFQLYHWNASGTATKVTASGLTIVDRFDNGQVIYAYRCPSDGTVSLVNASAYNDYYLATLNQALTVQLYYNYWDNQENANCYFPELDKTGAYLNNDGSYTEYANHCCSHYIAVNEGDTLTFGPAVVGQGYHVMGFNADKKAVTGKVTVSGLTCTDTFADRRVLYTYEVPAGVAYVRVLNSTSNKGCFVIFKNNPITVEDYNEYMGITIDTSSPLYRKTALFVGDSICYGSQDTVYNGVRRAWAGRIAESRGMLSYVNNGVSGASLSTARGGTYGRILTQLQSVRDQDFDYVVLHGGVNDAWDSYPVGTVSDSFDPADFDLGTYAGGLEELIYYAILYYGDHAAIGYLMNFYAPNCTKGRVNNMSEYFAVGKQICEKWGISYYDMYNSEEISEALKVTTTTYLGDNIHPNSAGYDILYPFIAQYMETMKPFDADWYWADQYERLLQQAEELQLDYFTAESAAAFTAVLEESKTSTDPYVERYQALLAAGEELVQGEAPIPTTLLSGIFYQSATRFGVASGEDFQALANAVNTGMLRDDVIVYQTADLDLTDYPNVRIGLNGSCSFNAVYDGQGHTISNYVLSGSQSNTAMFPALRGTLKNFTIENAQVSVNGWSAIVASRTYGTQSLIENVHVKNSSLNKTGSFNGVGIIVCQPDNNADSFTLRGCTVSGTTVTITTDGGRYNFGFIASKTMLAPCLIENCYAYGNTFSNSSGFVWHSVGGLIGESLCGTVRGCGAYNNQYNGGVYEGFGGLVGLSKTQSTVVENSYCAGTQTPVGNNGPFEAGATLTVQNCYSAAEGTLTEVELLSGALAVKLNANTSANWVQQEIPMVDPDGLKPFEIKLSDEEATIVTLYTDWEGKLIASKETLLQYGAAWKLDDTVLGADALLDFVFSTNTTLYREFMVGDVNQNGVIETADVVLIMQSLNGMIAPLDAAVGDVNGDGRVSIADAVKLLRAISGLD